MGRYFRKWFSFLGKTGSPEKVGGAALVFSKKNNICHHFVTYIFVTLCDKIKNRSFYD